MFEGGFASNSDAIYCAVIVNVRLLVCCIPQVYICFICIGPTAEFIVLPNFGIHSQCQCCL